MNTQTQEALKMAIEALAEFEWIKNSKYQKAINACKEALEQPMAFIHKNTGEFCTGGFELKALNQWIPLYTHPHQWQGLTDDEILKSSSYIDMLGNIDDDDVIKFARAIEQSLKDKNDH